MNKPDYVLDITCLQCKKEYKVTVVREGRGREPNGGNCPSCKFCGNISYDWEKEDFKVAPVGSYGCELCDPRCEQVQDEYY
jgi:hypothetical protein